MVSRASPEAAPRVAEIEQHRLEAGPDASLAHVLLDLEDAAGAAERRNCRPLGRLRAHAGGQIAVGERLHGRPDLVVQIAVERLFAKERAPQARQSRHQAHGGQSRPSYLLSGAPPP